MVLVADDDPFNLRLLQEVCEAADYGVLTAADGTEVLDVVARERPDVVLLDLDMPKLDGLEVLRILKADAHLARIPVLLVAGTDNVDAHSRGIELGAEDYLTKPYRVFEVQQRIRNALRASSPHARYPMESIHPQLVDPATRTGTVLQLRLALDYEFTRAARYGHPLTCILVRIDNFTELQAADFSKCDAVLAEVASGLRNCVRAVDHIFRSRQDVFSLLLPETDGDGAAVVLRRIETACEEQRLWNNADEPTPTITMCFASSVQAKASSGDHLLELAEQKLFGKAKS